MVAERGSAFLLKIGSGGASPIYATVAGMKTTQLTVNGDLVAITNKDSGGWRELLSGAGVRSVSVSGSGIFTGSSAEVQLRGLALGGGLAEYELSFESGERMQGRFLVSMRMIRRRTVRDVAGPWATAIDFRARLLAI